MFSIPIPIDFDDFRKDMMKKWVYRYGNPEVRDALLRAQTQHEQAIAQQAIPAQAEYTRAQTKIGIPSEAEYRSALAKQALWSVSSQQLDQEHVGRYLSEFLLPLISQFLGSSNLSPTETALPILPDKIQAPSPISVLDDIFEKYSSLFR